LSKKGRLLDVSRIGVINHEIAEDLNYTWQISKFTQREIKI